MKFGEVPLDDALGAVLAHSVRLAGGALKKGRILAADDIAVLRADGRSSVIAARLEHGDFGEDEAAARIADACHGENLKTGAAFTGRCNLTATAKGVVVVDRARVDRLNAVDESVTLATLPAFEAVGVGRMAATVKIIPFAVSTSVIEACAAIAADGGAIVDVAAFRPARVGLIQTRLPGLKESVAGKTVETTRARLGGYGATLDHELRCDHTESAVAAALGALRDDGCAIALVLGASAIVDRRDVVPAAIGQAGGTVEHFGMPVDPGNLMLLARLGDMRVLGLPGSARSPRLHGFDWVLQRLIAGIAVSGADLMAMGVGGLLKEIPSRPMPREDLAGRPVPEAARGHRIGAVILAAGQSRRMGSVNKLVADIDGTPMVARVADAVLASAADPVVVALGHEADRLRAALAGRDLTIVHNPDYAAGLSTTLKRALAALPADIDGAVICLGDMPNVTAGHIDRLIAAFDPAEDRGICVPTFNGKRGNPVLWERRYFGEIAGIAGDVGARHLIGEHGEAVCEVAMGDSGVLLDLDTPEALAAHTAARRSGL